MVTCLLTGQARFKRGVSGQLCAAPHTATYRKQWRGKLQPCKTQHGLQLRLGGCPSPSAVALTSNCADNSTSTKESEGSVSAGNALWTVDSQENVPSMLCLCWVFPRGQINRPGQRMPTKSSHKGEEPWSCVLYHCYLSDQLSPIL